jgi:hypothetical protein
MKYNRGLDRDKDGTWHVRQRGRRDEIWDLFCLDAAENPTPAVESLAEEIAFTARREAKER